jgi:hypothetical protein
MAAGCVFGTCVLQTNTLYVHDAPLLLDGIHVYLFASLVGPECAHVYVPKTWFLIRRHEARMHQSAVSRRAVNLEQSSLLIRWLINAGERARALVNVECHSLHI